MSAIERQDAGPSAGEPAKSGDAPTPESDSYAAARASWGFPAFARDFPRHPELDALVAAFARGDHATVRARVPKLCAETTDDAVKRAAEMLRARTEPDPTSKFLFFVAAALLVFLTAWWVTHDGPDGDKPTPKPATTSP